MNPPESFVPLTAAAAPAAPREFHLNIINGHMHNQDHGGSRGDGNGNGNSNKVVKPGGFQSLETPRSAMASHPAAGEKKLAEPRVTVQREGDRVTHLRIQCTCGQIMDIACVYDVSKSGA